MGRVVFVLVYDFVVVWGMYGFWVTFCGNKGLYILREECNFVSASILIVVIFCLDQWWN